MNGNDVHDLGAGWSCAFSKQGHLHLFNDKGKTIFVPKDATDRLRAILFETKTLAPQTSRAAVRLFK